MIAAADLNAQLATDRLVLEPLTAAHAALLFEPLQDDALYTWISAPKPESLASLRARYERHESRISPDGQQAWLNWAVRIAGGTASDRPAESGAYAGKIDAAVDAANVTVNLGYLFFPAFWRHGYASEAVLAVVEHLERHGVTELHATVTSGHRASARVLEKAGFVYTRTLPANDHIRGVPCDDLEFTRTARR